MKELPTLNLVYKILSQILGSNAYILTTCIEAVELVSEKECPTLGVSKNKTLLINSEFWKQLPDEDALKTVLFHELMHVIFDDIHLLPSIGKDDPEVALKQAARNIAMDARINSYIHRTCNWKSSFFTTFYSGNTENPLNLLLYPKNEKSIATLLGDDFLRIYTQFYEGSVLHGYYELYLKVLEYLRKNTTHVNITLIGDHDFDIDAKKGDGSSVSKEELEQIRNEIKNALLNSLEASGEKNALKRTLISEGAKNNKINLDVLARYRVQSVFKNVKLSAVRRVGKYARIPTIPSVLTKFDMVRAAMGIPVALWKALKYKDVYDRELLPIYFDVSGSMDRYIPDIVEMLVNLDEKLEYLWLFSTEIKKHTIQQLKDKEIYTTGGTDFDIVINHAVENNFTNIIVITDGHCSVSVCEDGVKHPNIKEVVTVLIENGTTENWFSKTYNKTHALKDLVCK